MRFRRLLAASAALVVPAAIVIVSATGSVSGAGLVGPGTGSRPAGDAPVSGGPPGPWRGGHCHLEILTKPSRIRAGAPGDVSVSIPPTVFIRFLDQDHMVVTTNTRAQPKPRDDFWVIDGNEATPASHWVRAEVMTDCVLPTSL
jgi:hypothetical protein